MYNEEGGRELHFMQCLRLLLLEAHTEGAFQSGLGCHAHETQRTLYMDTKQTCIVMVIWYAVANCHNEFRHFGDSAATFISEFTDDCTLYSH